MKNFFSRALSRCLINFHHNYFHNYTPKSPLSTITIATTRPIHSTHSTHATHQTHPTHHTHNRGPFSSYSQSFRVLNEAVRTDSQDFRDNEAAMLNEISKLNERLNTIGLGGGEKVRNSHLSKKKMLTRDRINSLIDAGTPFLELSALAGPVPAGIIRGIGIVSDSYREVMIVANNVIVKGGTYFQFNLPCICLVDSGVAFLSVQDQVFPDKEQEHIYVAVMSDESVIVRQQGTIFLGGAPLIKKAAINADISEEELGGVDVDCRISGVADHYAENDEHAFDFRRNIISNLNRNKVNNNSEINIQNNYEPLQFDADEILGLIPKDTKQQMDMRLIIARMLIVDSKFDEFEMYYGQTLIADFARICGIPVGIVVNNEILFSESAQKGAHLVELCSQRKIIFSIFTKYNWFYGGKEQEQGVGKHGAKMVKRYLVRR